jgi:TonB family protein
MFGQPNAEGSRKRRRLTGASMALHGLLLAWLLHTPAPLLLSASSVTLGRNGNSVTPVFWPTPTLDDSKASSPMSATQVYRRQRLGHEKLIWKNTFQYPKLSLPPTSLSQSRAEDEAKAATLSNLGHGSPSGPSYGTLNRGPAFGDEIRIALPVATADPVVYPWELPDSEGKVIVEITIDERGEIVQKTVLQSLGPKIDDKVLAALENWRFHPATRNGVAIPSKQDAVFSFRARG